MPMKHLKDLRNLIIALFGLVLSASAFNYFYPLYMAEKIAVPKEPYPGQESSATTTSLFSFYASAVSPARSCPSLDCEVIGRFPLYAEFELPYITVQELPEWVKISWTDERGIIHEGFIQKSFLSTARQTPQNLIIDPLDSIKPSPPPSPPPPAPRTASSSSQDLKARQEIALDPVIAIKCEFSDQSGGNQTLIRGSGIIVHAGDGYILTNRHVVDIKWAAAVSGDTDPGYKESPDNCKAALIDGQRNIDSVPKPTYPFNPYPYFDVLFWANTWDFTITPYFIPKNNDLSKNEADNLDFAILKITSWNSAKYFGDRKIPVLRSTPILISSIPLTDVPVLVPGFAYQSLGDDSFDTFRLVVNAAKISQTLYGDQKFKDTPMIYETFTESPDVSGGRSGSPVFWNGYAVGLHQSVYQNDRRKANAVSSEVIGKVLKENGLGNIIELLF